MVCGSEQIFLVSQGMDQWVETQKRANRCQKYAKVAEQKKKATVQPSGLTEVWVKIGGGSRGFQGPPGTIRRHPDSF